METTSGMKPLNTADGWENIVNPHAAKNGTARERVAARRKERRTKKLLTLACMLAVAAIAAVILGITGAVHSAVVTIIAGICVGMACFTFGRYLEVRK